MDMIPLELIYYSQQSCLRNLDQYDYDVLDSIRERSDELIDVQIHVAQSTDRMGGNILGLHREVLEHFHLLLSMELLVYENEQCSTNKKKWK